MKTMRRVGVIIIAIGTLIALPGFVEAQSAGSIRGRVMADDGRPLSGAQVILEGTTRGTLTNPQGQYLLVNVPAGSYTLQVRQIGYATGQAQVSVATGGAATQDFTLTQEAVAL